MKSCFFSNRIYKNTLNSEINEAILNTKTEFNTAVRTAYNMTVKEEFHKQEFEQSIHLTLKNRFGYDDYYTNSILREAKGIYKSNVEIWKLNISKTEDSIENRKSKIKSTEKSLKNKEDMLKSMISIHKASLQGKKLPKFKTYKGASESFVDKDRLMFQVKSRKEIKLQNIYEFEVCYLKPEIKRLKNRLKQLKYGLKRAEEKLSKLKKKPNLTCFGSKGFFKSQFTKDEYIKNHSLWKREFDSRRNKSFQVSGRKDATQGNFVFRYNKRTLSFKDIKGSPIEIQGIIFPYGQEMVDYALSVSDDKRSAVAWEIEDRGLFYIVKVIIELPKKDLNYSKSNGIIGFDLNEDHLALTNITADGNLIGQKIIRFNLYNKTSNQTTNILGNVMKEAVAYCVELGKPIGREVLDTEKSKSSLKYGNKKRNRKLSQFAYSKMIDMIESRAYKDEIAVFSRNPAYTSQIGKLKYMKNKGLSVHTAASYVVGRRALGFKEKVPNCYKGLISETIMTRHHWSHWRFLSKDLKCVMPKHFYKSIKFQDFNTVPQLKEFLTIA